MIISEKQFSEISRILEIMEIDKNIISESRIGRDLVEKIRKDFFNNMKYWKREFPGFSDAVWSRTLNALKNNDIHNLPPLYQKKLAEIISLKKSEYVPEVYTSVIENWLKDNSNQNYKSFLKIIKNAKEITGRKIDELLTGSGMPNGKAVIQDVNGNPDYFSIDMISPTLESELSKLIKGKDLQFKISSPPRPKLGERIALKFDKTQIPKKYPSAKAFYEGMLRSEPGSSYFFKWLRDSVANIWRRVRGKDLIENLGPEEKKIALRWFLTGVADWPMVTRMAKSLGWKYVAPNILGQIFRKWLILSTMFTTYELAKNLYAAAPESAEQMEVPTAMWKRVAAAFRAANPSVTAPVLRLMDFIFFTVIVPAVRGGSKYGEALDEYFDGSLNRIETLLGRTKNGENVQDEVLQQVSDSTAAPRMEVEGVPMPNANDSSSAGFSPLDTSRRALGIDTSRRATDSSAVVPDEEDL